MTYALKTKGIRCAEVLKLVDIMFMTKDISWANYEASFVGSVETKLTVGYRERIVFQGLSTYSQV